MKAFTLLSQFCTYLSHGGYMSVIFGVVSNFGGFLVLRCKIEKVILIEFRKEPLYQFNSKISQKVFITWALRSDTCYTYDGIKFYFIFRKYQILYQKLCNKSISIYFSSIYLFANNIFREGFLDARLILFLILTSNYSYMKPNALILLWHLT